MYVETMKRLLRGIGTLLGVVAFAAAAWGWWKNPEHGTIDARARVDVAGGFVGSTQGITHYDISGPDSGRTVVLVHGFSVPSYIWDSTVKRLSEAGYRTLRYDLFGRGWSDRPDAPYDGPMYDAQLNELLDSLHVVGPVDLMGLSFGGFVTAHYLTTHSARVRSLTLVDPVATTATVPGIMTVPVLGPWLWQTRAVPTMPAGQPPDFLHPEHFPDWVDRYLPQMRFRGFGRALLRSRITLSKTDFNSLYAQAGKTGVPVLLMWGKQDHTVPILESSVIRRNIPQVEFLPVDSAGHLPHIEQSATVHAKMLQFLAAHGGAPAPPSARP